MVRRYKGDRNSFQDVMRGVRILRQYGIVCNSFYLTLTKKNFEFDVDELLDFCKTNGFNAITIEPDLIDVVDIDIEILCGKILECYYKGKHMNIDVNGFWKRPFNNMLNYEDSTKGFCRALDFRSIVIDKDGYLSPCGYSNAKITKVERYIDLVQNDEYRDYIYRNLKGNIHECVGCEIEGLCKGGCLISRENAKSDKVFEYRCEIYKRITKQLLLGADFV